MQNNPAEEWRQLEETYRSMFHGELENLAADMDDLTEAAREVLRAEMKRRGLAMPGGTPVAVAPHVPLGALLGDGDAIEDGTPVEFTWKAPLCECEDRAHAIALTEALDKAGIASWYEGPQGMLGGSHRLAVAADQLDEAQRIAAIPIAPEVLEQYRVEIPVYETPHCPECGEEDPVLESAEPTNSWLCEACGCQWVEAGDSEAAG